MLAPTVLTHLEGIIVWQETAASFGRTEAGFITAVYNIGRDNVDAMDMMGGKGLCGGLVEDVKGIILAHGQSSQSTPPNRRRELHFDGVSIPRQTESLVIQTLMDISSAQKGHAQGKYSTSTGNYGGYRMVEAIKVLWYNVQMEVVNTACKRNGGNVPLPPS